MESLVLAVAPYVDLGLLLVCILGLRVAWSIYLKIVEIEKAMVGVVTDAKHVQRKVDMLEDRVLDLEGKDYV